MGIPNHNRTPQLAGVEDAPHTRVAIVPTPSGGFYTHCAHFGQCLRRRPRRHPARQWAASRVRCVPWGLPSNPRQAGAWQGLGGGSAVRVDHARRLFAQRGKRRAPREGQGALGQPGGEGSLAVRRQERQGAVGVPGVSFVSRVCRCVFRRSLVLVPAPLRQVPRKRAQRMWHCRSCSQVVFLIMNFL